MLRRQSGSDVVVAFLVGWGANVLALLVVDELFDSIRIGRWGSLLLGAAVLGIGNAVLKPLLAVLALPLIIVSLGIAYFALNVLMLALAEWVAPRFVIDGFWTYVAATVLVWLVNLVVGRLLNSIAGGRRPRTWLIRP